MPSQLLKQDPEGGLGLLHLSPLAGSFRQNLKQNVVYMCRFLLPKVFVMHLVVQVSMS